MIEFICGSAAMFVVFLTLGAISVWRKDSKKKEDERVSEQCIIIKGKEE